MKYLFLLFFIPFSLRAEVLLKDIGVIGLMSHDIFAWDHKTETNTENGRLDLSTIFDHSEGKRWKKGGNPKNGENSPVYTITMQLVDHYKAELKKGSTPETARKKTVVVFHNLIKESFVRLSGLDFPQSGILGSVTNVEQAALRGMHDILPGRVKLFDRRQDELKVTNAFKAKFKLNEKELNQVIGYFNGDYDEEYKHIKIPFTKIEINLKETDRKFIEKFSPYKQVDMLEALAKVGRGELALQDVFFIHHIYELVSKAVCPNGNQWMPQDIQCQ